MREQADKRRLSSRRQNLENWTRLQDVPSREVKSLAASNQGVRRLQQQVAAAVGKQQSSASPLLAREKPQGGKNKYGSGKYWPRELQAQPKDHQRGKAGKDWRRAWKKSETAGRARGQVVCSFCCAVLCWLDLVGRQLAGSRGRRQGRGASKCLAWWRVTG
ncbi:hypothetical protein BD289DRAFT_172727 [Coniella lustricola]|uniref:Uncharacterized protein n=1 Tax=Coniella lustricola TaxID=2025994 RepID=A0A2T2ZTT2_9PEZI|nr:hypothetical protein BD289DRAFT_172727 [Coniella lustricola]